LRLAARAVCALAWLWLAACATSEGPPFRPVAGEEDALRARLAAVSQAADGRQGLRAVGKLHVQSKDGSVSVQEVVLAERPARLRLESLNMLGQAQSLLVTDGERFAFFDGKRLEDGPAEPAILRDRLGLSLEPGEAVLALLAAPLASEWPPREILGRGEERELRGAVQSVRFAAGGELSRIAALDDRGKVRWQADYDQWRDVPGGRYPFSLVLSFPETSLRAELELSQVELNPALDPALFRVVRKAAP
jgi:outer membrane lipoprotein-sorting protein